MGGNRIEIFDPAARDRAEEERIQAWVERINEALANDSSCCTTSRSSA